MMTTGEKIRAARKKAGLTQKKLGELCGIAEPTIRRYELDKLNPKPETLLKIARPLGVRYADLYGDTVAIDDKGGFSISFSGGAKKDEVMELFDKLIDAVKQFDGNELLQNDMAHIFQNLSQKQGQRKFKIILQPASSALNGAESPPQLILTSNEGTPPEGSKGPPNGE